MTPLQRMAIACLSGILTGTFLPLPAPLWAFLLLACLTPCLLRCSSPIPQLLLLFTAAWFRVPQPPVPSTAAVPGTGCPIAVDATIADTPLFFQNQTRWTADIQQASACIHSRRIPPFRDAQGRIFLTLDAHAPELHRGDRIRFIAALRPLHVYRNPATPARPSRQPSFTVWLADPRAIVLSDRASTHLEPALDRVRRRIASMWEQHLDEKNARLAIALTIGQSRILTRAERTAFAQTGTAHLLAVSGLHLTIVVLLVFAALRAILRRIYRIAAKMDVTPIAAAATIPFVLAFTFLTGCAPPVVRACTMTLFVLIGILVKRDANHLQSLLLAAAGILCVDPSFIGSAGFQLSFASVAGLLFFRWNPEQAVKTAPEKGTLHRMRSAMRRRFFSLAHASIVASAMTTPILMAHGWVIPPAAPIVNLVAVPFATLIVMPLLLSVTALSLASPMAAAHGALWCGHALDGLHTIVGTLEPLSGGLVVADPLTATAVCLLCATAILLMQDHRRAALVMGAAGLAAFVASRALATPPIPPGELVIDVLDTGQGDCTLVTFPDGRHWLVDGGGTAQERIGADHLVPVLRNLGVRRLDTVVVTHPDADHTAGLRDIVAAFGAQQVFDNGRGNEADADWWGLMTALRQRHIPVRRAPDICGIHAVGDVQVEVLHPCAPEMPFDPPLSANDSSIVLRLSHHHRRVLLTGDLGHPGEQILLSRGALLSADVLKLGHHGSAGSSSGALLNAVSPSSAIASCGEGNLWKFPAGVVQNRLSERRIRLLRTDLQGAIRVRIFNSGIRIGPSAAP